MIFNDSGLEGLAPQCQLCSCKVKCRVCVCVASSGIVLNLSDYSCCCSGGGVSRRDAKSSFNEFLGGGRQERRCEDVQTKTAVVLVSV